MRKIRLLFVLVLFGSLFLNSCNKEEENNVENIEISDVFYEDYFDVDNIGLVRDSLYFINSEERLKQIKNDFPSVYAKISKTDFDKNTVVITASRQDYNLFKYEVKLFLDKMTATCKLVFSYVLDEPPYLEKTYFRVWVCVVPKMTSPCKSYVYEGIY